MEAEKELPFGGFDPPDMDFFQRMRTTTMPTRFQIARFFSLSIAELEVVIKDCYVLLRDHTAYTCDTELEFSRGTTESEASVLKVPAGTALRGWQIPWDSNDIKDSLDEVFTNLVMNHPCLQTKYAERGEATFVVLANGTVRRVSVPSYLDENGRTRFLPPPASMTEMIWRLIEECKFEIRVNPELQDIALDKLVVNIAPAKRKIQDESSAAAQARKKRKTTLVKLDEKIILKGKTSI